ncbi:MAG: AI-2E family transporter [Lachnospiraceae bacterium]|nr:AI-2E family transporter [Ruminococcus sp.]MCM1275344.1 AI-2E family transporter [Lachnospiraceae bacterium]
MKFDRNSKYFTIAVYAVVSVIISSIAIMIIFNIDKVSTHLAFFTAVATPLIIGVFCAYLLNPLMMKLENGLFGKWAGSESAKLRGRARAFSLTLTMLIVLAALLLIILLVIPQLVTNVVAIFNNMDSYIATARGFLTKIAGDYPQIAEFLGNPLEDFRKFITSVWNQYSGELLGFAGNVANGVWAVIDTLKNVFIGLTLSVYLLAKKEMFVGQTKKLVFAFVRADRAQRFLGVCREASKKFLGSIVGKIIEAFVVAMFVFIGCTIMRMPYAPLISMIMFVFNLIPFIGPFIGCIPCCLLLLLSDNPIMALWFVIFIVILQTVDGNIIAPWILGDSTGLPAVWILISIIIGGGLFGMLGMFLGVPVCAVIYMLFKDFVESKLRKRKLPQSTDKYVGDVDYITPDYVYDEPEPMPSPEPEKPARIPFREMVRNKRIELSKKHRERDKDIFSKRK